MTTDTFRRAQAEAVVDMLNSRTMDLSDPAEQREYWITLVMATLAEHEAREIIAALEASLQSGSAGDVVGWEWQASDNQWVRGKDDSDRQMRQYEGRTIRNLLATPAKTAGGWKLMPIEPPEAMCREAEIRVAVYSERKGFTTKANLHWTGARSVYRAMVAASPSPDGERQEGVHDA